jgi:hypothetical protein
VVERGEVFKSRTGISRPQDDPTIRTSFRRVIVVVKDRDSAAHGLRHPFFPAALLTWTVDPAGLRDVLESDGRRLRLDHGGDLRGLWRFRFPAALESEKGDRDEHEGLAHRSGSLSWWDVALTA